MTSPLASLRGRTTLLVVAMTSAAWICASIAMWVDTRHELDELLDAHLAQAASFLVIREGGENEELEHGRGATLHPYAPRVAFQVFQGTELIARSPDAPAMPMTGLAAGFGNVTIAGVPWRTFTARNDERAGRVIVAEQVASRTAIAMAVLRGSLWPMLLAMPLLAVAMAWATGRGLRPLTQLGSALASRSPTALDAIVIERAPSEMRPMLDALNGLFARTGNLLDSERRFTADAAHELRTPIAGIRAQAQAAMTVVDEEARRHALAATLEGCDRAARLIDQLLLLARLESGAMPEFASLDLGVLARQVLADATPAALAKRQSLEFVAPDRLVVRGSVTLLQALVRNLVDNAIRYSPDGARVCVTALREAGRSVLRVEDGGPGLGQAQRRRLGDRFFRGADTQEAGSGLGWSIVRRVAELHRIDVEVERSPDLHGLRVRLAFPA
jgi:two-component system, OmpR family, sensor histidine kinase QseC